VRLSKKVVRLHLAPFSEKLEPLTQARNQLGTPGGAKFSERGPIFLKLCPIVWEWY